MESEHTPTRRTYVPRVDTADLAAAIQEFQDKLPDWWFTVGACHLSMDASCAPDRVGCDAHLLADETRWFDDGFHVDLRDGSLADALRYVMELGLAAKAVYPNRPAGDDGDG